MSIQSKDLEYQDLRLFLRTHARTQARMHACTHAQIYPCTHEFIISHAQPHKHSRVSVHVCVWESVYVRECVCEGLCVRVCEKVSVRVWLFVHVCVCMHVSVRECVCVCVNLSVRVCVFVRVHDPRRWETSSVVQSAGLLIPRSSVLFWQKIKKPRTQTYMDLSYIDPQTRILNYCYK